MAACAYDKLGLFSSIPCSQVVRGKWRSFSFPCENFLGGNGRVVVKRVASHIVTGKWRSSSFPCEKFVGGNGRVVVKRVAQAKLSESNRQGQVLARDDLLELIAGEERGLRTQKNPGRRKQIVKAIDALEVLGSKMVTTDDSLNAAWRMLWTTEKEQLFIVEKAPSSARRLVISFRSAGRNQTHQKIIDVAKGTLNNVITFPPTGMFLVNSTMEVVSAQRVNFRFTRASLRVGDLKIPIPPFGQGWFESVYLDEKIRVAKDIRGDFLVVDRAPVVPNLL